MIYNQPENPLKDVNNIRHKAFLLHKALLSIQQIM